ncbi:hypothetical protein GOV12_07675 [Candidatus Pacearchaeota archaeon]|nr:hypothetical protein [Candidatus Pacearchaeota archaeon]
MVIIFKGQESVKKVNGEDKKVIPFAGTDRDGEFAQMGVGLIYPEEKNGFIWGLAIPHDIVASYRGMKIAEEVLEFGLGTLCACWYAGERSVHSSQEKYIHDIEGMIGADKRQKIIQAPLPCFDDAIKLMQENHIDFDINPFLIEAKHHGFNMTPILEQAVNDYSDRYLLFRGLTGDFEKAYQSMTEKPKGFFSRFIRQKVGSEHLDSARLYVEMVEQMLPSFIPDIERQYGLLVQNIGDTTLDLSQFDEHVREDIEPVRTKIYDSRTRFDQAKAKLRQTTESQMSHGEKFVEYHTALETMMKAVSEISSGFSTFEIYAGRGEPAGDIFGANKSLAEETVKIINRAARENIPSAYSLI